jgi:hypothetical protein
LSSQTSHLEGADPELAISFLRRGTTNLTSLKPRLVSCSDEWIGSFLDQGGLELLFECLTNLGEKRFANFSNAIDQLTCIGCIKAVMNSKVGLEHIVESQSYVRTLAEAVDTRNVMVKMQVFDLLAALSIYSEAGYILALDALDNYKKLKSQSYRFSLIMNELKNSELDSYSLSLLSLINCFISAAPSAEDRIQVRNEFIGKLRANT